ncbi:hypothetical protein LMG27952_03163 [Paraburkholderia hiiakae]|uniref:Uncharacterized protein n=1 Tax=Paraburkholderia hiiakae TaxID=1081782 RepID=A0ABN7HTJ8_9BURK|nr:hypothetical protein [Paraburkholderia hiiakae]CAD6536543.1 hypothetical protein LMG27952_03163 [Paraburkholderia hiiakae]
MGKKLDAARRELEFARDALARMEHAKSPEDFENQWKEALGRLTRFWNKTQASLKGDSKFTNSPHVKRINVALRSDPLIQYLARARDVDEHLSDDITGRLDAGMRFEFDLPDGNKVFMHAPTYTFEDGTAIPADVVGASRSYFAPTEVYAQPVKHRGKTYEPPVEHDGQKLPDTKPITMARMGIEFYSNFLNKMIDDGWDSDVT